MLDASKIEFTMQPDWAGGLIVKGEILVAAQMIVSEMETKRSEIDLIMCAKSRIISMIWRYVYGELDRPIRELGYAARMASVSMPSASDNERVGMLEAQILDLLHPPTPSQESPIVKSNPTGADRVRRLLATMSDAERLSILGEYCPSCGSRNRSCRCGDDS